MIQHLMHRLKPAMIPLALGLTLSGAAHAQTLVTWDDYTFGAQSAVVDEINKAFEAAHPGVTVTRTARTFDDLQLTLKLAVSAGDGPEVTKVNQGAGDMGTMVKENLLIPLDPYIEKFGWATRQSDSVLARDRWSDTGEFGVGKTYGISSLGEIVGLYYNMKLLNDAGITTPPATLEELIADADTLKEKGIAPFMIGTAKQPHGAAHDRRPRARPISTPPTARALDDLVYGHGGSWKTAANVESAKLVAALGQ